MLIDFPSTVNPLVAKKFAGGNIKKNSRREFFLY